MALPTCPHPQTPRRAGSFSRCWEHWHWRPRSSSSLWGQGMWTESHPASCHFPPHLHPQHQAAHARLCLYLLKSSQEGPQDLDQTAPSAATGKPGHRAGRPGGTAPGGWAQVAAEAQWEVAGQHWAAGRVAVPYPQPRRATHGSSSPGKKARPAHSGTRPAGWLRLPGGDDQAQRPLDRSAPSSRPADSSPLPYFAHTGGQTEKPEQEPAS